MTFYGWSPARFASLLDAHPFLGRVRRTEDFAGARYVIPVERTDVRFVIDRSHGGAEATWLAEGGDPKRYIDAAAYEAIDQLLWSSIAGNGGDCELMGVHRWMSAEPYGRFWEVDRTGRCLPETVECRDGDIAGALKRMWRGRERYGEHDTNARILLVAPGHRADAVRVDAAQDYTVSVVPCMGVPEEAGFLIDPHTWCLHTLGGGPHVSEFDGTQIIRRSDRPGWNVAWIRWYAQLACNAPWRNARLVFADHEHRWRVSNDDSVWCRCGESVTGMRMAADTKLRDRVMGAIDRG